MFVQQDPEEAFVDAPDIEEAPEEAGPSAQQLEITRIKNATRFSDNWNPEPFFKDQENVWPDTMRIVEERYEMFNVLEEEEMKRYSSIKLASKRGGHHRVIAELPPQWDDSKKTFFILLHYRRREFKTPFESETNPKEQ